MDLHECHKICNQKGLCGANGVTERHQKHRGDSYDYSNSDLHSVINIGRDARNVIISKRQEREETEAYIHTVVEPLELTRIKCANHCCKTTQIQLTQTSAVPRVNS